MRTRRARPGEVAAIHALIEHYAAQGLLLPRSEAEVREHVGRFLVLVEGERVIGCLALEPYGAELAEIRSLAVDPEIRGRGLGARLVRTALVRARRQKIARVFAVTHAPEFFARLGFTASPRWAVPEKIERDCRACPKERRCDLEALVAVVCPERIALGVLEPSAKLVPAI